MKNLKKIVSVLFSAILLFSATISNSAAIDVIIIGPKNQASGILKYWAKIALGKEIIRTEINLIENACFVFSR